MATKQVYNYVVSLKKQTSKAVTVTSVLLVIFACVILVASVFYLKLPPIFATVLVALMLLITAYENFWQKNHYPIHRWPLLIAAIFLMIPPVSQFWLGALYVVAAITEQLVQKSVEVGVDENGLIMNTFPKKQWRWHELNQVILKDGILTIDTKQNSLLQREIEDIDDVELMGEFNTFCQQQLQKNK